MNIDIQRLKRLDGDQVEWSLVRQIQVFLHGPYLGDWQGLAMEQAVAFARSLNEETADEFRILADGKELYAVNRNGQPEKTPGRTSEQTTAR